jgi:outer membrane receptor protein involved in Fe transport
VNEIFAQEQGGTHIAPQAYVDLFATFRSQIGDRGRAILYRLSVHNVLDKAPPFYVPAVDQKFLGDFGTGYSYFGDPLGRYFRLSIEASF